MPGFHSPVSPSSFKANALCNGRYHFSKDLPEVSRLEAKKGTTAHELLQGWLEKTISWDIIDSFTGSNGTPIDAANIQHVRDTYYWIVEFMAKLSGAKLYAEIKVDPGYRFNGIVTSSGTSDIIILDIVNQTIYVFDYKNGMLVVNEIENYQAMLYGIGAIRKFSHLFQIKRLIIGVLQPRIYHPRGPFRLWEVNVNELLTTWDAFFKNIVVNAMSPNGIRTPGEEQCMWCKGKTTCPEAAQKALADARVLFEPITTAAPAIIKERALREPSELTDQQIKMVMESYDFIMGWLKAIKEHVEDRFRSGDPLPGFKQVAGRGSRKWPSDDLETMVAKIDEIVVLPMDLLLHSKFKSPAQFENTIKPLITKEEWELINKLIIKNEGSTAIALTSDHRPAINTNAKDVFKPIK